MHLRLHSLVLSVCAAITVVSVPRAAAAQDGPYVDATTEWSPVTIGTAHVTWRVDRVGGGIQRDGRFGWNVAGARHDRAGTINWDVEAAGFRRAGEWTVSGGASVSPDPSFLYRYAAEGAVARRLVGGLVLQGGYRHLSYTSVDVGIVQPAATWYFRRGEVEARGFFVRRTGADATAAITLARAAVDVSRRVRLSGGAARGGRIFDVAALPDVAARGWVGFGAGRIRLTSQWSVTVTAAAAHEDPGFTQHTLSLGLRRSIP